MGNLTSDNRRNPWRAIAIAALSIVLLLAAGSLALAQVGGKRAASHPRSSTGSKRIAVSDLIRARPRIVVRRHHKVRGPRRHAHGKKTPAKPEASPTPTPNAGPTPKPKSASTPRSTPAPTAQPQPTPTLQPGPAPTPGPEPSAPPPPAPDCTTTLASLSAVQAAVSAAANGAVICLANGSYTQLNLNASKSGDGVTVRAANPGGATIAGASLAGSSLRLAGFVSTGSIEVKPGATKMTIEHNRITGGGQGIDAGPTTTTSINDLAIIGNQLIGPFDEDAIHLNRYHDADGDGAGVLIEGNEISGVRENGNHSDCLQTVWTGDHIVFRRNYLHDNRCQGFFVKDQASLPASVGVVGPIVGITVDDNLFVRNKEPCAPSAPGCGQPMYFQVFGPYSAFRMTRNTIWGDGADSIAAFREGTGADTVIANNVIYRLWTDTNMSGVTLSENTICKRETGSGGSWPSSRPGEATACSLSFAATAADDLRLSGVGGRGVDWSPATQHYGP